MNYIIIFLTAYLATFILKLFFQKAFRPKHRVYFIPTGMGFILIIASIIAFIVGFSLGVLPMELILLYTIGILGMGFVGMIDDLLVMNPNQAYKRSGFKGLMKGDVRTALLKTFLALLTAVVVCLTFISNLPEFFINIAVIIGFTNFMSIMCCGSGRAVKSFILFYLIIIMISGARTGAGISLIMLAAIVAYASSDLKSRLDMGDVGGNVLGIWLGITSIYILPFNYKVGLTVFLLLLNVLLEYIDFDALVKSNSILKAVDRWGTK